MAIIVIIALIYLFCEYKKDESAKKEAEHDAKSQLKRFKDWDRTVTNRNLELDLIDDLIKNGELSKVYDELVSIYSELGITNRNLLYWRNFEEEVRMVLMANRGLLPSHSGASSVSRYSPNFYKGDACFADNAEKIIPWAIKKLSDNGINENVYCTTSMFYNHWYLYGSAAYIKATKQERMKMQYFKWEPELSFDINAIKHI